MKRLTPEAFERARHLLKTQARPLDWALFEHRFEDAPPLRVIEELAAFQNPDGGFGHALEPDVRTPSSSALGTGIALSILKEVQQPAQEPAVVSAVEYLRHTLNEERQVWRAVPDDVNDHPHAPWWHDENGSLARTFDGFLVMPRAQLVALLRHYREQVDHDWLEPLTEATVADIETANNAVFEGGGDALRYALTLAETDAVPKHYKDRILPRLRALADHVVCRAPEDWDTYCATPLKIAPTPDSVVADLLWDDLQRNLDYVIDHQKDEGAWEPTWTWGDAYPEAWQKARQEWRGHVTLETLTSLEAFGRIDR